MSVVTAITISYVSLVPTWMNILLNTLYFAADVSVGYQFMYYAVVYEQAEKAAQKYANVTVFDSGQLSSGMRLLVIKAAKMAQEGASLKEILSVLSDFRELASTSFVLRETDFM